MNDSIGERGARSGIGRTSFLGMALAGTLLAAVRTLSNKTKSTSTQLDGRESPDLSLAGACPRNFANDLKALAS